MLIEIIEEAKDFKNRKKLEERLVENKIIIHNKILGDEKLMNLIRDSKVKEAFTYNINTLIAIKMNYKLLEGVNNLIDEVDKKIKSNEYKQNKVKYIN